MTNIGLKTSHQWSIPSAAELDKALQALRAKHPEFVFLTLITKLRTSRWKEAVLAITQLRYTNLKSAVLIQFQHDLTEITQGSTDQQLVSAITESVQAIISPQDQHTIQGLRETLDTLRTTFSGVMLVRAITILLTEPDAGFNETRVVLQNALGIWEQKHPDGNLRKTLEALEKARVGVKKSKTGEVIQEGVPKFTATHINRIRLCIILRKMITERVVAVIQSRRLLELAKELAAERDEERRQAILTKLTRHSEEQTSQRCITVMCERLADTVAIEHSDAFRTYLQQLLASEKNNLRKNPHQSGKRVPLFWLLVERLALHNQTADEGELATLREQLQGFLPPTVKMGTPNEDEPGSDSQYQTSQQAYVAALSAWLQPRLQFSTDISLLLELGEAAERRLNDGADNLFNTLSRCYSEYCSTHDYPLAAVLRSSVFRDCAKAIISWASLLSEYRVDRLKHQKSFAIKLYQTDKKTPFYNNPYRFRHFVLLPSLYIYWLSEANEYKAAAETEMPIGPDAGKLFGNLDGPQRRRKHTAVSRRQTTTLNKQFVGKRGVRRLQQWLQPEDVITQTLADIYVILYPRQQSKERLQQAKQAPHPYWTNKKRKQRITAVRPSQYREAKPGTRVPLGSLSREQVVSLRNQLQEQIRYKAQLAVVQTKITRFLEDAPPTYPSIAPMRPDPKYLRSLPLEVVAPLQADYDRWLTNYHRALQRTQDFRPMRGDPLGNYTDEHLFDVYALTAQELEQAAAQIEETDGQPISYSRTMGVNYDPKAFALLKYEQPKESGSRPRYILACEFSGEEAPEKYLLRQTEPPQQQEKRIMVNHPLRKYAPKQMSPNTMYFGMEMGAKHQIRKLRDVIQLQAKRALVDSSKAADSAIGTLNIVQERDSKGYKAWFAHFPIPVQTAPIEYLPNTTIGFHEYKAQYYYAVVDFNGVTLDLGEITLPLHLTTGEGAQSDNYVFGLAKAMINVSTSEKYAALIGIEDTLWKTSTPKLDAAENRVVFSHPRQRIFEVVSYKAAINGLLQPISVKHIAPSRDCGQCGQRTDHSSIQMFPTTRCFICSALGQKHTLQRIEQGTTLGWKCSNCNRHWQQKEPQFKCSACGYRQHARYNTAVVVAHALRRQIIDSNDRNKDEMEV